MGNVLEEVQFNRCVDCRSTSVSVESAGQATVIGVSGQIDASNADFMATILTGFTTWNGRVIVDLSNLDFIGTQGLRVLLNFDAQCHRSDVSWALVPCTMLRRLLHVIDMGWHLPVSNSVDDAARSLERGGASAHRQPLPRVAPEKLRC